MTKCWLRRVHDRLGGRPTAPIRKPVRLGTEFLEDRLAPSVVTINVTTADELLPNGLTSLREAVIQANAVSPVDDVVVNLQASQVYAIGDDRDRYQFNQPLIDTEFRFDDPEYGDFDIRRPVTINGNGSFVRAESHGRVFDIRVGSGTVTLNDLTALNGWGHTQGGGIYATGGLTLVLNNVTVFSNTTPNSSDSAGGGLYADLTGSGRLVLTGGEIDANTAAGSVARGGGVYVQGGQVSIAGTEFRLNDVRGSDATDDGQIGGFAYGGGLYASGVSQLSIHDAKFLTSIAEGGRGGADGGDGGLGFGGGAYVRGITGAVEIAGTRFADNRVYAGDAGDGGGHGGRGGSASGGAVYAAGTQTFTNSPFIGTRRWPGRAAGSTWGSAAGAGTRSAGPRPAVAPSR